MPYSTGLPLIESDPPLALWLTRASPQPALADFHLRSDSRNFVGAALSPAAFNVSTTVFSPFVVLSSACPLASVLADATCPSSSRNSTMACLAGWPSNDTLTDTWASPDTSRG